MEAGLKRVFADAVIGKLLIQTNPNTGDPEVRIIVIQIDTNVYITQTLVTASLL
jgi:uridine kinase